MRLDLYIALRYLRTLAAIIGFIMSVVFVIDVIDQLGFLRGSDAGLTQIIFLAVIRIPIKLLEFLPLFILLAGLFSLFGLARDSELVVMRGAGISGARIVFVPLLVTFVIGVLLMSVLSPVIVGARKLSDEYYSNLKGQQSSFVRQFNGGVWLREVYEGQERLFFVEKTLWGAQEFRGIEAFITEETGERRFIKAPNMRIENGAWLLASVQLISAGGEILDMPIDALFLPTNQKFGDFVGLLDSPLHTTIFDYPRYLAQIRADGYDPKPAESHFWQELFSPLLYSALCLIGAVFALAPMRGGGVAMRVIFALGSGFFVYAIYRLAIAMGKAGDIPVLLSVVAVPIGALMIFYALLLRQEDG